MHIASQFFCGILRWRASGRTLRGFKCDCCAKRWRQVLTSTFRTARATARCTLPLIEETWMWWRSYWVWKRAQNWWTRRETRHWCTPHMEATREICTALLEAAAPVAVTNRAGLTAETMADRRNFKTCAALIHAYELAPKQAPQALGLIMKYEW